MQEFHPHSVKRIVIGITGASGAVLGIQMLKTLKKLGHHTHLILSTAAQTTILQETGWKIDEVTALASQVYDPDDVSAAIASGSFPTDGMVIIPCSIKTLSAVANAYTEGLISRAADVTLKEGRPLILVVREAPLHRGHLRLMSQAVEAGAIIFPPVPAFYAPVQSLEAIVQNIVGRVLVRMDIENSEYIQWKG
jgi:4-hydroxy-3-polyprenylbenzoate decarboxylase